MAKRRKTWKKEHRASGATVIARSSRDCRLTVIPNDWTKPKGPASWNASCAGDHARGNSRSVKSAKVAATRAAKKMGR